MTIVSLKSDNSRPDKAIKIEFSDSSSILIAAHYLPDGMESGIFEKAAGNFNGKEISSAEEEAFNFAAACYRAEKAAARLIARAEQSSFGLISKLERRGYDSKVAKAVVSFLSERDLLDDTRYAERWICSRLKGRKAPSPRLLFSLLAKKGINADSSRKAMKKALDSGTEYVLLSKFMENQVFSGKKGGISLRSHLKFEGFSPENIEKFIESNGQE